MKTKWDKALFSKTHGYIFQDFLHYQETEYVRVFLIFSSLLHFHKPGNTCEGCLTDLLNNFLNI